MNKKLRIMKGFILILTSLLILMSCVTQKPILNSIPDEDNFATIFYCIHDNSINLNKSALYELKSFGKTNPSQSNGTEIENSSVVFSEYPLGRYDYSYRLLPSISNDGKYIVKAVDDFKVIDISFSRNIEIHLVNTENGNTEKFNVTLPILEYGEEKYQLPWSEKNNSFFGVIDDSLFRFSEGQNSQMLLYRPNLYDFKISPLENFAVVFADDSLFLFEFQTKDFILVQEVGRVLGINPKYIRGINWFPDESKFIFAEGSTIYIYSISDHSLSEFSIGDKVFDVEWVDKNNLICVTGDYPDDLSHMRTSGRYRIMTFNINTGELEVIHRRLNHEPFTVKPKISPSKKLILFSEKPHNAPYQVKLMSLDGLNESVLAEGFLPFWAFRSK